MMNSCCCDGESWGDDRWISEGADASWTLKHYKLPSFCRIYFQISCLFVSTTAWAFHLGLLARLLQANLQQMKSQMRLVAWDKQWRADASICSDTLTSDDLSSCQSFILWKSKQSLLQICLAASFGEHTEEGTPKTNNKQTNRQKPSAVTERRMAKKTNRTEDVRDLQEFHHGSAHLRLLPPVFVCVSDLVCVCV